MSGSALGMSGGEEGIRGIEGVDTVKDVSGVGVADMNAGHQLKGTCIKKKVQTFACPYHHANFQNLGAYMPHFYFIFTFS